MMTLNTRTAHTSPIDCNGLQVTNAYNHMVPKSILWYRGSYNWNIYNWNQVGKYNNIALSDTLAWTQQLLMILIMNWFKYVPRICTTNHKWPHSLIYTPFLLWETLRHGNFRYNYVCWDKTHNFRIYIPYDYEAHVTKLVPINPR